MMPAALRIFLTGVAMGAADIVPGVSGGTVAFLSGLYDRLVGALARLGPGLLGIWRRQGWSAAWQAMDGSFLVTLSAGILVSILTLSHVMTWALSAWPQLVWGFFFGLVLSGVYVLVRPLPRTPALALAFLCGTAVGLVASNGFPAQLPPTPWNLFWGGALAICAMILPGISGSFILLLLGLYLPVIEAIKSLNIPVMAIFASGCVVGLISFSRILHWLLARYHQIGVALLAGVMAGALFKLWPWKYTLEYQYRPGRDPFPLVQANVWPQSFEQMTGQPAMLWATVAMAVLGGFLVIWMSKLGTGSQK